MGDTQDRPPDGPDAATPSDCSVRGYAQQQDGIFAILLGFRPLNLGTPGVLRRSRGTQEAALVGMLPRGRCSQPEL